MRSSLFLVSLLLFSMVIFVVHPLSVKGEETNINFYRVNAKFFVTPDSSYDGISDVIDRANNSLKIMVYEFWSEDILDLIVSALNRGVRTYVLLEGNVYGESGDNYNRNFSAMLYSLNQSGKPIWVRFDEDSYYMHAKVIIADSKVVFVASENFFPTAYPKDPDYIELRPYDTPSRGWGVVIYNSTVAKYYEDIFDSIFFNNTRSRDYNPDVDGYGEAPSYLGKTSFEPHFGAVEINGVEVSMVSSPENSFEVLKWLISRANYTIYMEELYMLPGTDTVDALIQELRKARDRGVTIHILLEDDMEAYGSVVDELESYGFHVEGAFKRNEILFLHNKGIIVDDYLVLIGSINWSGTSISKNREAGVLVKSRDVALYYKKVYEYDWNLSSSTPFDSDGDGLSDYYEKEHGYNPNSKDTDGDGINDWEEVFVYGNKYGNYEQKLELWQIILIIVVVAVVIVVLLIIYKKWGKRGLRKVARASRKYLE